MKHKWYRGEIIERFMDDREIAEFEKNYEGAKIVNLGRKAGEDRKVKKARL